MQYKKKRCKKLVWALQSTKVTDKATYYLNELDGAKIRASIVGKRIKFFYRRDSNTKSNLREHEDETLLEQDQDEVL